MRKCQAELLIEVAVVDIALPVHADQAAAHHLLQVLVAVRCAQRRHVGVELSLGDQHAAEALNRHVGEREQAIEHDAVTLAQMLFIRGFERGLGWRQARALRVVDQVEDQAASRLAIAQRIQPPEPLEAGLENAFAALLFNVLFQVARQGGDDFDAMGREKHRQIVVAGFLQYGQVAAVDHAQPARARGNDQAAEIAVQLGCPPGEIDGGDLGAGGEEIDRGVHGFVRHLFFSIRSCVHVAVHTALVAAVAKIQLQRFDGAALQAREIGADEQGQGGVHEEFSGRTYRTSRQLDANGYKPLEIKFDRGVG